MEGALPSELSVDAVVTLLLFLVGVPVLVLQFMSPEIRTVLKVEQKIIRAAIIYLLICIILVTVAVIIVDHRRSDENALIWMVLYILLLALVGISSFTILSNYGFREKVLGDLTSQILQTSSVSGKLNEEKLRDLIEIGKQSNPGPDREMILESMRRLVDSVRRNEKYEGDSLENLIIGIVHVLATRPAVEDTGNYQTAVGILTTILSSRAGQGKEAKFVDQFHAVNAMSTLGQIMLAQEDVSTNADFILMDFEEALGLVVSVHPELLPDVAQALLSMGSVAIHHKRYLFAVATLERLLTLVESNKPVAIKPLAELLGLTAHFWCDEGSSRDFIKMRIPRLSALVSEKLPDMLIKAERRFQMTMRFDTADKLSRMAKELKSKPKPRRKKK